MIIIAGIGWIDKKEYGCILKGLHESYQDKALPKKKIFSFPFKNFGRLDNVSKLTCAAIALALRDAGVEYAVNRKQDIGIISTNTQGSFQADMLYFRDYLDSGRTLSRGNLFIYTLPSSPSGEAAIHFGLQGPLLYVAGPHNSITTALTTASEMIANREISAMLAGLSEEDCAVYFVLEKNHGSNALCDFDKAMNVLGRNPGFGEMIKEFTHFRKGNGI